MTTTGFDGRTFCRTLTSRPGVYRMLDADNHLLYVGKARNLKKRVSSYFTRVARLSPKVRTMLARTATIEVTMTHTETEALLLENNLIKEQRPRYNVTLRDDKSFPWIYLSSDREFPRLSFHRGRRSGPGRYFGPYPNAGAVRASINQLQKLFRIRNCADSFFRHRTRPCLQYQIRRCTAPCVGLIAADAYREDVAHAELFLQGRGNEVIDILVPRMEDAAQRLDYELAARYRDQIADLKQIRLKQHISGERGDCDVVAAAANDQGGCVQIFFVRGGLHLGNRTFFFNNSEGAGAEEILSAFLTQYYLGGEGKQALPAGILINYPLPEITALAAALSTVAGHKVRIQHEARGENARWLAMAEENARHALTQRELMSGGERGHREALRKALGLPELPERIECFDISHTRGEATVGACVVSGPTGPIKSDYRRYNIEGIMAGDDYAAMRQVVERRYGRVQREDGKLPDLVLIDGGPGQVAQALSVLQELGIADAVVVGVAKGPARKPGQETLVLAQGGKTLTLPPDSAALHLIQRIRDEAHRFAITGHRQRRARRRNTSSLEEIDGIGSHRRRTLIQHFGGLRGVARAGVEDLCQVPGISRELAQRIYERFHAV
ncbi:MAG TPA: excinuclease ABC subunit UvrC [Gammaproteobacteria bacterium]|nr:excinuclease ABC subunit UvrC [Gammaproteobacteria bacterium]